MSRPKSDTNLQPDIPNLGISYKTTLPNSSLLPVPHGALITGPHGSSDDRICHPQKEGERCNWLRACCCWPWGFRILVPVLQKLQGVVCSVACSSIGSCLESQKRGSKVGRLLGAFRTPAQEERNPRTRSFGARPGFCCSDSGSLTRSSALDSQNG